MLDAWTWAAVYLAGALVGLVRVDATPAARLGLALVWPLGPLAFAMTLAILLAASLVAFPLVGVAVGLAGLAGWAYSVFSV